MEVGRWRLSEDGILSFEGTCDMSRLLHSSPYTLVCMKIDRNFRSYHAEKIPQSFQGNA